MTKLEDIEKGLANMAQLANIAIRLCHYIEYAEARPNFIINTEQIRNIMKRAINEPIIKVPNKYDELEFTGFLIESMRS